MYIDKSHIMKHLNLLLLLPYFALFLLRITAPPHPVPAVFKVLKARIHCFETQATLETSKAHVVDHFILVVLIKT